MNRNDFPTLKKKINGKPIVYLDSACMSLKPTRVVETVEHYYYALSACAGRSVHTLSRETTEKVEDAREKIRSFLRADSPKQIVFTKNTTEAINLVANGLGLSKSNAVLSTDFEHNSNMIPWQKIGVKHRIVKSDEQAMFTADDVSEAMTKDVKLVSMVHTSNITGWTIPAKEIAEIAHDNGALFMLDAAQSVPHKNADLKKIDCDLLAFSGHKILGPTGTGVLYGKENVLKKLKPLIVGGETVVDVTYKSHKLADVPERFEAGLQNYAGIIGLRPAVDYLRQTDRSQIKDAMQTVNRIVDKAVREIDGSHIIGPRNYKKRGGITNFFVDGCDAHDIAAMADQTANIMIRSGANCAHSFYNARNVPPTVRSSAYLYNNEKDAKVFAKNIGEIVEFTRK